MKIKHLFLFTFFLNFADVFAQKDSAATYFTHRADGYSQFYYNEQYYLVDENCKFRHYTRIIKKGENANVFEGYFSDYYNNNKIALTGTYANGKKNGVFSNYYYNGKLKSEIRFENNKPIGIAKYYYDNGTPWMIINHKDNKVFITDYWDPYGEKKVTEGKGRFEYQDWAWGFNETGYNSIVYSGRLKNGLPAGSWNIYISYPNSPAEFVAFETFKQGEFVQSYSFSRPYYPNKTSNLKFYPSFDDQQAEKFVSKDCNIDEIQNYTSYLEKFLNRNFNFNTVSNQAELIPIVCEVMINDKGESTGINIIQGESNSANTYLKSLLNAVPFWIPSFIDGKTENDKLRITFILNAREMEKRFENLKITREKEK